MHPVEHGPRAESPQAERRSSWPSTVIARIATLKALAESAPLTAEEAAARFTGAKREIVARHLETLAIMGELQVMDDGR